MDDAAFMLEANGAPGLLVVSFSHIEHQKKASFAFVGTLRKLGANRLFLRDLSKRYYLGGIDSERATLEATADWLRLLMRQHGERRTIFVGNSSGAWAALLYGILLRPHGVIAFAPRTFLDRKNRRRFGDQRNPEILDALTDQLEGRGLERYYDLAELYAAERPPNTRIELYWDRNERIDHLSATRMWFPGIAHHPQDGGGHLVAEYLQRNDRLLGVIQRSVHPVDKSGLA